MEEPIRTHAAEPTPPADGIDPTEAAEAAAAARRYRRRSFAAAFGYLGIYLGTQIVLILPFTVLVIMRAVMEYAGDMDAVLAAVTATVADKAILLTAASGALTVVVLWILFACRKKRFLSEISLLPLRGRPVWPVLLIGICANLSVSGVLSLLPAHWLQSYSDISTMLLGEISPLLVLFVVLLAPVVEEIVFRGLIYTRLRRALPRIAALLLASLLFGLLHEHPVWIAYTFVLGLLLNLIFDWYGSLLAPICLHLAFNGASFLSLLTEGLPVIAVIGVSLPACVALLVYIRRKTA